MKNKPMEADISNEQLLEWFSASIESENDRMAKAPVLFQKGEGIEEVPNEIDDDDQ